MRGMRRRDAVLRGASCGGVSSPGPAARRRRRRRCAGRASATISGARIPVQSLSLMAIIFRPYLGAIAAAGVADHPDGPEMVRAQARTRLERRGRDAGRAVGSPDRPASRRVGGFFRTDTEKSADDAAANVAAAVDRIAGHSLDARHFDPAQAARPECGGPDSSMVSWSWRWPASTPALLRQAPARAVARGRRGAAERPWLRLPWMIEAVHSPPRGRGSGRCRGSVRLIHHIRSDRFHRRRRLNSPPVGAPCRQPPGPARTRVNRPSGFAPDRPDLTRRRRRGRRLATLPVLEAPGQGGRGSDRRHRGGFSRPLPGCRRTVRPEASRRTLQPP